MKVLVFAVGVLGLAAVSLCAVPALAGGRPVIVGPFGSLSGGAWGDDRVYDLVSPVILSPATESQEELYVIAPVDPAHPQSLFALPHDRVIPIPANNRGEFSAIWRAV